MHWTDNLATKIRATPLWLLFAWLVGSAFLYWWIGDFIVFGFIAGVVIGL